MTDAVKECDRNGFVGTVMGIGDVEIEETIRGQMRITTKMTTTPVLGEDREPRDIL